MPEDKQDILREVLQIYVNKDSSKHTELEKRRRLTSVINDYVKGSNDEEDEA